MPVESLRRVDAEAEAVSPPGKIIPIQLMPSAAAGAESYESLYEKRQEIYPRARIGDSLGYFQRWRWLMVWITQLVFYGMPWLSWNGRQAVLFDLGARKFYLGGLVLWPQDIVYLTALLIISALSLFLFTAIGGRLWCGYACPQTVYTEIFMWIERRIEGDRAKRMALDRAPRSARKFAIKCAKHAAWIAVSLWTGFTFVGYFTPVRQLGADLIGATAGGWEVFWLLFYGFATYGNAGWMREQVCKYMCPYARFQSAMFDKDTLIVTYDSERGEPRGVGSRSQDRRAKGLGDCVDCGICVQVCPTGIDIRNGLQYECIGCAACIDGCNYVMDKAGLPRGLIRYATTNALTRHYTRRQIIGHVLRPRTLIYGAILGVVVVGLGSALWLRVPLKVDVIRDRGALAREVDDGLVENVYRLQVMNTAEQPRRFTLSVAGIDGLAIASESSFDLPAASARTIAVRLRAPAGGQAQSSRETHGRRATPITFDIAAVDAPNVRVREKSTFLGLRND